MKKYMEEKFISEFFELENELEELGVFDSIMNKDSHFFINLLRLKRAKTPEFANAYKRINDFFGRLMLLLDGSKEKYDKLYNAALNIFDFPGVKGINLGLSETGVDAGFGPRLSEQVINDAFEIVKAGSKQPEIFQLVGLFENNVGADRLSDMIASIILEDIKEYTRRINRELNLDSEHYEKIVFKNGIAINPYKKCELLYVPKEILHEIPIARCWSDIDRVISENEAIRAEVNEAVGSEWSKMCSSEKKGYLKRFVFEDAERCGRLIDEYKKADIDEYNVEKDLDYFISDTFKRMKKSGVFNFLEHSDKTEMKRTRYLIF